MELTAKQKAYQPHGTARELMYYKGPEVLMSGPAGTGKSRACLEKLHILAEKYPGMRALILRKTRESLTQAALVTYENEVVPEGHPVLSGPKRNMRQSYRYPNGSEIVVGGLDKSQKVMSTQYDIAYIQEAIEVDENDWENVTTRLRNGVLPYQQLMADTNPSYPTHWLKKRCDAQRCKMFDTPYSDNPVYWDHRNNTWTPAGAVYIEKLDNLTGARYYRLRKGLWVAAEGAVYDLWDPNVHIVDRFDPPFDWLRIWSVDFGFTNPFVWHNWVISPDDEMFLYQEYYHTGKLVEDVCPEIRVATLGQPKPQVIVCDHDAEDRETFKRHIGLQTKAAFKSVSPGLQAVSARMKLDVRGRPKIAIMRGTLIHPPDPALRDKKLPLCTSEEVDGYIWDVSGGQKKGDQPLKENDHGQDAKRYAVAFKDKVGGGGTSLTNSTPNLAAIEREKERLRHAYGYKNRLRRERLRAR